MSLAATRGTATLWLLPTQIPGARPLWRGHPAIRRLAIVTLLLLYALAPAWAAYRAWARIELPFIARVDTTALFLDREPVDFTIRSGVAPWRATATELRTDTLLWQRMHLTDWDSVPAHIRVKALDAMLTRYRYLLTTPSVWDAMTPGEWDRVPQPVRTVAYRQMMAYWGGFYHVGADAGLDPVVVRETLAAIVMQESWFEHRAVSVSRNGNRDLGLAQASDFARARMAAWHAEQRVDLAMTDVDFFDPWKATRFLAIWMTQLLRETGGDLDRAVGAYHRGSASALDARGAEYLRLVQHRRTRFIRNHDAPASWSQVWRRGHAIELEDWTWLAPRRPHITVDDE